MACLFYRLHNTLVRCRNKKSKLLLPRIVVVLFLRQSVIFVVGHLSVRIVMLVLFITRGRINRFVIIAVIFINRFVLVLFVRVSIRVIVVLVWKKQKTILKFLLLMFVQFARIRILFVFALFMSVLLLTLSKVRWILRQVCKRRLRARILIMLVPRVHLTLILRRITLILVFMSVFLSRRCRPLDVLDGRISVVGRRHKLKVLITLLLCKLPLMIMKLRQVGSPLNVRRLIICFIIVRRTLIRRIGMRFRLILRYRSRLLSLVLLPVIGHRDWISCLQYVHRFRLLERPLRRQKLTF